MRLFDANIQENLCNPTSAAHDAANQLLRKCNGFFRGNRQE
jgi:hypothetical protein